jgi:hypothetical protein
MLAEVVLRTKDVFTVKVALVAPAGTVALEGTLAAPLLLESRTCAPPAGAGPLSVTVPVEDCTPPVTLVGFSVSEETIGRGGGVTVRAIVVVCLKVPDVPVIVRVNVPVGVVLAVVTVIVEEPEPVTEVGLKVALAPDGSPLALKVTAPANPFTAAIVAV